jgi:hypothetical protein
MLCSTPHSHCVVFLWVRLISSTKCWLGCSLPVQSVPITTKVVNWILADGELYSIQHYVIKFVSDLRLSPIRCGFAPSFVNCKKACTRLAAASDKVYQLLAHGWWFSPGTLASSTTKTGLHDIADCGIKHQKSMNQLLICLLKDNDWLTDSVYVL